MRSMERLNELSLLSCHLLQEAVGARAPQDRHKVNEGGRSVEWWGEVGAELVTK